MRVRLRWPIRPLLVFVVGVLCLSLALPAPVSRAAPGWPRYPVRSEVLRAKEGYTYRDRFEKKLANRHTVAEFSDVYFDSYRTLNETDQLQSCHVLLQVSTEAQIDAQDGGGWLKYAEVADLIFDPAGNAWRFQMVAATDIMDDAAVWIKASYRQVPGCYKDDGELPPTVPVPITPPPPASAEHCLQTRTRAGYETSLADPAAPLRIIVSSTCPDWRIWTVTARSQVTANPAVVAALGQLGAHGIFESSTAPDAARPDLAEVKQVPVAESVELVYDTLVAGALPAAAGEGSVADAPGLVSFLLDVKLMPASIGDLDPASEAGALLPPTVVGAQADVQIEGAFAIDVLKVPVEPVQPSAPALTMVGGRVLNAGDRVVAKAGEIIRVPRGVQLGIGFLDGTAGVISLGSAASDCYMEMSANYGAVASNFEHGTVPIVYHVNPDQLKAKGKDWSLKFLAKQVGKRALGPAGSVVIDLSSVLMGQSPETLARIRLRSTAGVTWQGDGTVLVRSLDGTPEIIQPDGTVLPVPQDSEAARAADGFFATPTPVEPVAVAAWLDAVPVPTAPPTPPPAQPSPSPVPAPVGPPTFSPIRFGTNYTNHQLVGEASVFPAGTRQVFAAFPYSGLRDGMSWGRLWLVNGAVHMDKREGQVWDGGAFGTYAAGLTNDGGLPGGTWELVLYLEGREVQRGRFVIEPPGLAPAVPAAVTTGPTAACAALGWTGTWDTGDWGMLAFVQAGNTVTGAYSYWGRDGWMEGTVDPTNPRALTGRWYETNRAPGEGNGGFQFTMSADCTTFTGIWGYGNAPLTRTDYFGRRVSTAVPVLPPSPARPR